MSIWGKLAGAATGLAVGGPIGALLGGVAGHMLSIGIKNRMGRLEIRSHSPWA
jgi:hypothetical protein